MKKISTIQQRMDPLVKYVTQFFEREPKIDNVSIAIRPLDKAELEYLRKFFASVEPRGFMGYVAFTKKKL